MRFACCKLGQEGFLVTFLHADGIAQSCEAAMHVGDQRIHGPFDVFENDSLEVTFFLQPMKNAGHPVFRIDLLGDTDNFFGMFLVEILDESAKVGCVGLVGNAIHNAVPLQVSLGGSIGPPASIQALMPPSRCATGLRPMSWAVFAASADRQAPAQ